MLFVETRAFTRRVEALLPGEVYRALQAALVVNPDAGPVIRGSGGLRKLRWSVAGRGKRGGARVIYYHHRPGETLLMLFVFAKNERSDLSSAQLSTLREIVEKEYL